MYVHTYMADCNFVANSSRLNQIYLSLLLYIDIDNDDDYNFYVEP